jgi:hypothetical protein
VLAVCQLRGRFKKLDRIRFELWWAGQYTGNLAHIRKFLISHFETLLNGLREHRDSFDDPFAAAEAAVSGDSLKSRDPVFRAMRRFAKTDENLRSAAYALFLSLFGAEVPWHFGTQAGLAILAQLFGPEVISDMDLDDPSLAQLVEQVTGLQRAKSEGLDGGETLLDATADVIDAIETANAHRVFDLDDPGWAIKQSTDAELEGARKQARLVVDGMGLLVELTAVRRGRDYAGLSILRGLLDPDPGLIVLYIQLFLLLPSLLKTDQERTNVANTLEALAQNLGQLRAARAFLEEHPSYAFIVTPDGAQQLKALPAEEQNIIRSAIQDFFNRHPEFQEILAPLE